MVTKTCETCGKVMSSPYDKVLENNFNKHLMSHNLKEVEGDGRNPSNNASEAISMPSDTIRNLGGRPPNPQFKVQPKEFDLIKWVAEKHHIKNPGEFAKRIVMNYCKNYYIEQKKMAEEKKVQAELAKEKEQEELIKEIEEDGGIAKQKKYVRNWRKEKEKNKNNDDAPIPEGAIINSIENDDE